MDNSRILIISDTHAPYAHRDAIRFLDAVANQFSVTRVIHIGDEVDFHGISFHDHDQDLFSAGHELVNARLWIAQLAKLFPVVDLLESNHGSLVFRKAKALGLPSAVLKGYREVLEAPNGWKWHDELLVRLPDRSDCLFGHGKVSDPIRWSKSLAMHTVNGHYHEQFRIQYWRSPRGLFWSMVIGCLIDGKSLAFAYNKLNIHRPILGVGLIVNSLPILVPMLLNNKGRWTGSIA